VQFHRDMKGERTQVAGELGAGKKKATFCRTGEKSKEKLGTLILFRKGKHDCLGEAVGTLSF